MLVVTKTIGVEGARRAGLWYRGLIASVFPSAGVGIALTPLGQTEIGIAADLLIMLVVM